MQNNSEIIRQINAYAMKDGIVLGLFGILSLYIFKESFSIPFFSTLFFVMLIGSPVLGLMRTLRYRSQVYNSSEGFGFFRGFLHAFFMGFYASIWVAVGILVYLKFFDHGTIFAAYEQQLSSPQMMQVIQDSGLINQMNEITGGHGVKGIGEAMRQIGAETYAAISLYMPLIFGPFISAIIGLIARMPAYMNR